MKRVFPIALMIILFVLPGTGVIAFDPNDYRPLSINEVALMTEAYNQEPGYKEQTGVFIIAPSIPFQIQARFLGEIRPLTPEHLICLEAFQKTFRFKVDARDIYRQEVHIADLDGREYWLPIQEVHWDYFRKEYSPESSLTLYLVWALNFNHEPFVIINEFSFSE